MPYPQLLPAQRQCSAINEPSQDFLTCTATGSDRLANRQCLLLPLLSAGCKESNGAVVGYSRSENAIDVSVRLSNTLYVGICTWRKSTLCLMAKYGLLLISDAHFAILKR